MKKILIMLCLTIIFTSCAEPKYEKYSAEFYELFDTITIITGFEKSRKAFDEQYSVIYSEMERLHRLYDVYNDYDNINNVKTINDNAGIQPVAVDKDLLELIEFGKRAYDDTNGTVNIALGSVLRIWHEYRANASENPETATAPSVEELADAAAHTNINDIVIDKDAGTVFLKDKQMSLDLGAVAKGYAVELAGKKARESGFSSGLISGGGNIYAVGMPMDGRERWSVGVQNPFVETDGEQLFDAVFINDGAIVSSGDYQRYFVADGRRYHHIIDPETLMPADKYSGVTVYHPDSGIADMLSTSLFVMTQEEGERLVQRFGGEAIWIHADKTYTATDGYEQISKLYGVMP